MAATFRRCLSIPLLLFLLSTMARAERVPRWGVADLELESADEYANPLWDVTLTAELTAPSGRVYETRGFWDGENDWRVRFSPDEVGTWTWDAMWSDTAVVAAHGQSGTFECVAAESDNPLLQHGPIRLSEDRLFFEHTDGTPYFFLSCTAWNGVLKSSKDDWETYLAARQDQGFTAIQFVSTQWRGGNKTLDAPVFIDGEKLTINPEMFQRMDQRVAAINAHGLVACPVILWALGDDDPGNDLSDDNAMKLAQYIVDRWGAYNVIWMLSGDCRFKDDSIDRWKARGRELFGNRDDRHLVTLHPSGENWIADKFRDEEWFDFIGYQSGHGDGEKTLAWHLKGPVVDAWKQKPARPIINLEPNYEAHPAYQSKQPHPPQHVRRAAYWSLMVSPPAGLTYGHNTIWVWNEEAGPAEGHGNLKHVEPWTDGVQAEGAKDMGHVRQFFESGPWTTLRPAQQLLARQPGDEDLNRFVTVASSPDHNWTVAYTPVGDTITLRFPRPIHAAARWFDPRTGSWTNEQSIEGQSVALQPPTQDDWLLSLRRRD